jgi:hypothetical protein
VLHGALQRVQVGHDLLRAVLAVLCRRNELQSGFLRLAVLDLVGHGDEQARVGSALRRHANGRRDVCPRLDVLAGDGGYCEMHGGVRPCAVALLAVEVLDEGGEGVEVAAGRVPADKDLAGVRAQVQGEHLLLVVHVDLDLLGRLRVGDGVAVADLDLGAVFAAGAEEGADDALLVGGAAQRVVEYGEDGLVTLCQRLRSATPVGCAYLGLDGDVQRGGRGREGGGVRYCSRNLGRCGSLAARASEIYFLVGTCMCLSRRAVNSALDTYQRYTRTAMAPERGRGAFRGRGRGGASRGGASRGGMGRGGARGRGRGGNRGASRGGNRGGFAAARTRDEVDDA